MQKNSPKLIQGSENQVQVVIESKLLQVASIQIATQKSEVRLFFPAKEYELVLPRK